KLNYGTSGIGTLSQLASELFKQKADADIKMIVFKDGSAAAITALLGGHIDMVWTSIPVVAEHIKSGKLVGLAVATEKRVPSLPDVPTLAESGLQGMEFSAWFGLSGPKGMPKEIASKLQAEVAKAFADKTVVEQLASTGADLIGGTPEQFAARIEQE